MQFKSLLLDNQVSDIHKKCGQRYQIQYFCVWHGYDSKIKELILSVSEERTSFSCIANG